MIAPPRSGGSGLAGKSGRKAEDVCHKHAKETTRNTAARFMLFLNHCSTEIAEESSREKADAVIRVYDAAGNVIETHEHKGDFKEW
jgi:uncharacterized Zn ribbon protein